MVRPAINKLTMCLSKFLFFMLLFVGVGKTLGNPYDWVNDSLADKLANILYGFGHVGGEEIDDIYFYIDVITALVITVVIYVLTVQLIKKVRS